VTAGQPSDALASPMSRRPITARRRMRAASRIRPRAMRTRRP